MIYPRVLIVAMGRINAADTANNGLLLRNLFGNWPRENLAQIFSGGDNGDTGFFGSYYQLGPRDRRFGQLFFKLKSSDSTASADCGNAQDCSGDGSRLFSRIKSLGKYLVLDTGLYELVFQPRLSGAMCEWVLKFKPDIIFAQGYNLTFSWLPVMLAKRCHLPIVYYPTDDWPVDLYRDPRAGKIISENIVRTQVENAASVLVKNASVRLAFNKYMREEYVKRYGFDFNVLMHGDSTKRFKSIKKIRLVDSSNFWIVSTGVFDHHRTPLLHDLEIACQILNDRGKRIAVSIFHVNLFKASNFKYLKFYMAPNHDDLAAILRCSDMLFLPERFDKSAEDVRLCISSKAHLFMCSGRPAIVYADPRCGICRYAREDGWAAVVDRRDPEMLAATVERFIDDREYRESIAIKAKATLMKNHELATIQANFQKLVYNSLSCGGTLR